MHKMPALASPDPVQKNSHISSAFSQPSSSAILNFITFKNLHNVCLVDTKDASNKYFCSTLTINNLLHSEIHHPFHSTLLAAWQ